MEIQFEDVCPIPSNEYTETTQARLEVKVNRAKHDPKYDQTEKGTLKEMAIKANANNWFVSGNEMMTIWNEETGQKVCAWALDYGWVAVN